MAAYDIQYVKHLYDKDKSSIAMITVGGQHNFLLSNFNVAEFHCEGKTYRSMEHYFQAQRFYHASAFAKIDPAKTIFRENAEDLLKNYPEPVNCKSAAQGMKANLSPAFNKYWRSIQFRVMKKGLRAKLDSPKRHKAKSQLKDTGSKIIVECSKKGQDKFWAVVNGLGENYLGRILMELRDEYFYDGKLTFESVGDGLETELDEEEPADDSNEQEADKDVDMDSQSNRESVTDEDDVSILNISLEELDTSDLLTNWFKTTNEARKLRDYRLCELDPEDHEPQLVYTGQVSGKRWKDGCSQSILYEAIERDPILRVSRKEIQDTKFEVYRRDLYNAEEVQEHESREDWDELLAETVLDASQAKRQFVYMLSRKT